MSDTSSQQQEPSMEEILASIRRIISEDSDEGKAAASAADEEAPIEDAEDDVLELTEVVPDDESVEIEEPTVVEEPTILAAEERDEPTVIEEETYDDGEEEDEEPTTVAEEESEALISEAPAAQAADAIAGLMARVQSSTQIGNRDLTIEQLTKDLLRPLLKEWLDANLPGLVERIVTDEIERVVARSMKK